MKSGPPPVKLRREEFERLYAHHSREVWAVAYARRMDSDLAMEMMQEAFLRLWKSWRLGEAVHNPRAWLMRVARNLAEDDAKSAFRKNGTQAPEVMSAIWSGNPSAPDLLVRDEMRRQVRDALQELAS